MGTERWLVTGASGQLGSHLVRQLARECSGAPILALALRTEIGTPNVPVERVDLGEHDALQRTVVQFHPTHVIHLGAMTAVSDCFAKPTDAERINAQATRVLAEAAEAVGARFVFSSTDMVFGGDAAPYREDDPPQPLSQYGRTKVAAERLLAELPRTLVIRIPLLYGFALSPRATTFGQQIAAIKNGQPVRLFVDEFRTPIWVGDAARAVIGLARSAATGVMHVAGPRRLSRYELIAACAVLLGIRDARLEPISRMDLAAAESRPADLSLDGRRFNALFPQLAAWPLREAVFVGAT